MNNSVKKLIETCLIEAAQGLLKKRGILRESLPPIFISQPKKKEWGDLSTNFAFSLARVTGQSTLKDRGISGLLPPGCRFSFQG